MKRKIIALVQARTDSTRFPKKVLQPILNKPMIIHQLQRVSKSKFIDELILVTSDNKTDDELANIVVNNGFKVFRGDKDNVLKRFIDTLKTLNINEYDVIVRLTGDCPLHDAKLIDESVKVFVDNKYDYLANCIKPIYPDGLDVEVFNYSSLNTAYLNATKKSDFEHVTPYIRDSGKFTTHNLNKAPIHTDWRLTVDEKIDFELIKKIYENFNSTYFSFDEIVTFLMNNTQLLKLNHGIDRNEGYLKSLKNEEN